MTAEPADLTDDQETAIAHNLGSGQYPLRCADCGAEDDPTLPPWQRVQRYALRTHRLSGIHPVWGTWERIPLCHSCWYRHDNARHERHPVDQPCDQCQTMFTPTRSDARYCSQACRQRAYRGRH